MPNVPHGLRENPFVASHDPCLIYSSRERLDALARLRQSVESGESIVLVTGDAGVGKTSAVAEALASREDWVAAFVTNPSLSRGEPIEEVCHHFRVAPPKGNAGPQSLARLERHLVDLRARGQAAVLVVDEAHDLSFELFEAIRLLSNLEADGRPLLQIVLVGLPELEEILARPKLGQLRERIATHCRMLRLSAEETARYVHHRVSLAGWNGPELFPRDACLEIHRLTNGIPRAINTLAGRAMLRAAQDKARAVVPAHVRTALFDLRVGNPGDDAVVGLHVQPDRPTQTPPDGADQPRAQESEVREWVARFIGPEGPPRIGVRAGSVQEIQRSVPEDPEPTPAATQVTSPPAAPESQSEVEPASRTRSLQPEPESARPGRRIVVAKHLQLVTIAAATVAALIIGVVFLARMRSVAPRHAGALLTATSRGAEGAEARSRPHEAPSLPPAVTRRKPAHPAVGAVPARAPDSPTTAPQTPARRHGLEVATYINEERAEVERGRLAERTGMQSRILTSTEDGSDVHRIVLGSFASRRAAERAADDLIARGLVNQARVVPWAEGDAERH